MSLYYQTLYRNEPIDYRKDNKNPCPILSHLFLGCPYPHFGMLKLIIFKLLLKCFELYNSVYLTNYAILDERVG